jgi:hypothetical protein
MRRGTQATRKRPLDAAVFFCVTLERYSTRR